MGAQKHRPVNRIANENRSRDLSEHVEMLAGCSRCSARLVTFRQVARPDGPALLQDGHNGACRVNFDDDTHAYYCETCGTEVMGSTSGE